MLRAEVSLLYFKVLGFHYYFLSCLGFEKTLFDCILSATFVLLTPSRSLAFTQFQNNLVLLPCSHLQPKYSSGCSCEHFCHHYHPVFPFFVRSKSNHLCTNASAHGYLCCTSGAGVTGSCESSNTSGGN